MSADELGRRRALLLGCGAYDSNSIADLRAPRQDVRRLAQALSPSGYEIEQAIDKPAQQIREVIEDFFGEAKHSDQINVLFLSCHGVRDAAGNLIFLFADSNPQRYLSSTGIAAAWVRDRIVESRSSRTVVLLDCCYSGAFPLGTQARAALSAHLGALSEWPSTSSGIALLASSGADQLSLEQLGEDSDFRRQTSYFTEAVAMGLAGGDADLDSDGFVTFDELAEYVARTLRSGPSPQRPHQVREGTGRIVITWSQATGIPDSTGGPSNGTTNAPLAGRLASAAVRLSTKTAAAWRRSSVWASTRGREATRRYRGPLVTVLPVFGLLGVVFVWTMVDLIRHGTAGGDDLPVFPNISSVVTQVPIDISRRVAKPGDPVVIRGSGFQPGERVQVMLSSEVVGAGTTDSRGHYRIAFRVPIEYRDLGRVATQLNLVGGSSLSLASIDFVIDPDALEPSQSAAPGHT